jgi:periplasmic protein TonB
MTAPRTVHRVAIALGFVVLMFASPVYAQDGLSRAKGFYASASYEEALNTLVALHGKTSAPESTEVAMYEVFCLVALGRGEDARKVIEGIVKNDPEYHLTDAEASPRVRAMFDTFRLPLLPDIVRESYGKGREAFDRKDMPVALKYFDRVMSLVGEIEPGKDQGLSDLATLASGFRDLAKMAVTAKPAAPAPAPANAAAPSGAPSSSTAPSSTAPSAPPVAPPAPAPPRVVFGPADADVKPPVAISQSLPPWHPDNVLERKTEYRGLVDLLIDEKGRVLSVAIVRSVNARYDPLLLNAARTWSFKPATKDGRPVQYRSTLAINLGTAPGR